MNEDELIDKLKHREPGSFEVLVDQYKDKVFRTCYGMVQQQEDAEDLTQEVFVEIYRSLPGFRQQSSISTWIYRITVNKTLNFIRSQKRKAWVLSLENLFYPEGNPEKEVVDHRMANPAENLERKEIAQHLRKAVEKLPPGQRAAFTLFNYEGLHYKEIAEIMNTSLPAVESMIFRAKSKLQRSLYRLYINSKK